MIKLFLIISFILLNEITFSQENCNSARIQYLELNPDVKKANIDPWTHYTYYGKNEGRKWPNCEEYIITEDDVNKWSENTENNNSINSSVYIPTNINEFNQRLNVIPDDLEKVEFINKTIFNIKEIYKNDQSKVSNDQFLVLFMANLEKIQILIPLHYESPFISQAEWEELLKFLEDNQSLHDGMSKNVKAYLAWYLYWIICVRQKLNKQDIKFHKMVVNEFSRSEFDPGTDLYDQIERIVNNQKISTEYSSTRTCTYKFVKPYLTITWVDNRRKCCNPNCYSYASYNNVKEDNLKKAETQYLNDALEAHFLEINADAEHRYHDRKALIEYKSKNYYNENTLENFDLSMVMSMFDVAGGVMMSATLSGLQIESKDQKIVKLKSKKKKLYIYNTSNYCSKSCEQYCLTMGYNCN